MEDRIEQGYYKALAITALADHSMYFCHHSVLPSGVLTLDLMNFMETVS